MLYVERIYCVCVQSNDNQNDSRGDVLKICFILCVISEHFLSDALDKHKQGEAFVKLNKFLLCYNWDGIFTSGWK